MILIADAHINANNDDTEQFFLMLDAISKTKHDVVFLGDIFELWIALPRYEQHHHIRFLNWCKSEKKRRTIGYVEGNHEFFLKDENCECFTWISTGQWVDKITKTLFAHGDLVNKNDTSYRKFRWATKNSFSKKIVKYMPFAPMIVKYIKLKLTNTNKQRGYIPKDILTEFAKETFNNQVTSIVLGHFHNEYHLQIDNNHLFTIPDWMTTKKVTVYKNSIKDQYNCHWSEIETLEDCS